MLNVGLDLSRKRVDVCLISGEGELIEHFRAPAARDGLYGLTRRVAVHGEPVRGMVESMNAVSAPAFVLLTGRQFFCSLREDQRAGIGPELSRFVQSAMTC